MSWPRLFSILIFLIFTLSVNGQKSIKIKVNITLRPTENFRGFLNNCDVIIYKNNLKKDSLRIKNHNFKKVIRSEGVYKFEFKKNNYVTKHVIINANNFPINRRNKYMLKADISLFHISKNQNVKFLDNLPISRAYYNEIKEDLMWDFEYNRSIVEKIIHAQTKLK